MITLVRVEKSDEYILQNIMQFYLYEFSAYEDFIKLDSSGVFPPIKLNQYWEKQNQHAFFILKDKAYIGFALVESANNHSPNVIQEFFIMNQHKSHGYGKLAASQLFRMFLGRWRIVAIGNNIPAQKFWRKVLLSLSSGRIMETKDKSECMIFEFHTDDLHIV